MDRLIWPTKPERERTPPEEDEAKVEEEEAVEEVHIPTVGEELAKILGKDKPAEEEPPKEESPKK